MNEETARLLAEGLQEAGITFVASLPEKNLEELLQAVDMVDGMRHVRVTREDEGLGVCAGAYLGGGKPAMVMMNTGFLVSGNTLTTVFASHHFPVLMVIGYSGGMGERYSLHTPLAKVTEPVLRAMNIPYDTICEEPQIKPMLKTAQIQAHSSQLPVAVLLMKDALHGAGGYFLQEAPSAGETR